jgi:hypothetical protein
VFAPFLAGQDLTASLLTTGIDNAYQIKGVTTDLTVSSTTFQTASELSTTLVTSASYIVQCQFVYDSNTTADIQIRFTAPVGTIIRLAPWGPTTGIASNAALTSISATVTDSTTTATISYGGAGAGSFMMARPSGSLISVSGAGTLDIAFAQVSASGSTLLKVGSMVALSRIF